MILGVVQARMSSSRLPGKVLADLHGAPMIVRQLERLTRARRLDRLVVATSDDPSEDSLAEALVSAGVELFRGALGDVLGRFAACLAEHPDATHVVRLTADCPLAMPHVVDEAVEVAIGAGVAYAGNAERRTFPKGLDVEVVTADALQAAAAEATDPYEREHVTPFVRRRPERFPGAELVRSPDLSHWRWTVDYAEDLAFAREVYAQLFDDDPAFGLQDVLELLMRDPRARSLHDAAVRAAG